jgi:hypothetical protein
MIFIQKPTSPADHSPPIDNIRDIPEVIAKRLSSDQGGQLAFYQALEACAIYKPPKKLLAPERSTKGER